MRTAVVALVAVLLVVAAADAKHHEHHAKNSATNAKGAGLSNDLDELNKIFKENGVDMTEPVAKAKATTVNPVETKLDELTSSSTAKKVADADDDVQVNSAMQKLSKFEFDDKEANEKEQQKEDDAKLHEGTEKLGFETAMDDGDDDLDTDKGAQEVEKIHKSVADAYSDKEDDSGYEHSYDIDIDAATNGDGKAKSKGNTVPELKLPSMEFEELKTGTSSKVKSSMAAVDNAAASLDKLTASLDRINLAKTNDDAWKKNISDWKEKMKKSNADITSSLYEKSNNDMEGDDAPKELSDVFDGLKTKLKKFEKEDKYRVDEELNKEKKKDDNDDNDNKTSIKDADVSLDEKPHKHHHHKMAKKHVKHEKDDGDALSQQLKKLRGASSKSSSYSKDDIDKMADDVFSKTDEDKPSNKNDDADDDDDADNEEDEEDANDSDLDSKLDADASESDDMVHSAAVDAHVSDDGVDKDSSDGDSGDSDADADSESGPNDGGSLDIAQKAILDGK